MNFIPGFNKGYPVSFPFCTPLTVFLWLIIEGWFIVEQNKVVEGWYIFTRKNVGATALAATISLVSIKCCMYSLNINLSIQCMKCYILIDLRRQMIFLTCLELWIPIKIVKEFKAERILISKGK